MAYSLTFADNLNLLGVVGTGLTTLTGNVSIDYGTNTVTGSLSLTAAGALGAQTYTNLKLTQTGTSTDPATLGQPIYTLTGTTGLTNLSVSYTGQLPKLSDATVFESILGANVAVASGSGTVTSIACYASGTMIQTAKGDVAVERLAVGDVVVTASGAERPIRWIGHRSYSTRFARNNPDILPVCFKAGSLADNVPVRDLWVSPKHAMFIDGVLVPAEHLVNGVSVIRADRLEDTITYWHVELDQHDVLLAEGAPSESFVDDESRNLFQNAHTFGEMYPGRVPVEAVYCAPRVDDGYALETIRRRVGERAGLPVTQDDRLGLLRGSLDLCDGTTIAGWAMDETYPEAPVCLDVVVDGVVVMIVYADRLRRDLAEAGMGNGHHAFHTRLPSRLAANTAHTVEIRRSADGSRAGRLVMTARESLAA